MTLQEKIKVLSDYCGIWVYKDFWKEGEHVAIFYEDDDILDVLEEKDFEDAINALYKKNCMNEVQK